jgi:tRNA (cytidine/uridine-2'-O-)-methyltransferase
MDYWEQVEVTRHINFADFQTVVSSHRIRAFTTRARQTLWEVEFGADDVLLFGPESRGLPERLLDSPFVTPVRIPMLPSARSLNLASAVSAGLYEALRQTGFAP